MAKDDKKKNNWRDKYRFSVTNDHTFEEIWRIRLTQYNAFLSISSLIIFLIGATACMIAFTNLKEFIPGYPNVTMRRNILMSAIRLDSLDRELALRDKYFDNLNSIISGNQPLPLSLRQDSAKNYKAIKFSTSPEDSVLRTRVENEERYNLTLGPTTSESVSGLAS